jgi:hypothetical protein
MVKGEQGYLSMGLIARKEQNAGRNNGMKRAVGTQLLLGRYGADFFPRHSSTDLEPLLGYKPPLTTIKW